MLAESVTTYFIVVAEAGWLATILMKTPSDRVGDW
jgi:hypothetical protein